MSTVKNVGWEDSTLVLCVKKVGEKENGVQCEIFEKWWHAACAGLSQEEYNVVQKVPQRKSRYCTGTALNSKNAVGVLKLIKVMQERQDKMEKEISELKKEIN